MDRSFVSHLLSAACAAVLAPLTIAQAAPSAVTAPATQESRAGRQTALLQVRLAEVVAMLEEDDLTPDQRKKALAKLSEVQVELAELAADTAKQPRMVRSLPPTPAAPGDKPVLARAHSVPMPPEPAAPPAQVELAPAATAPSVATAPAAPAPQRAIRARSAKVPAPAATPTQVEVVELPVAATRAEVAEQREQVAESVRKFVRGQPSSVEYRTYTSQGQPIVVETTAGEGESGRTVSIRAEQERANADRKQAVALERAARASAEQARVHAEQAYKLQHDAERMRAAAEAQSLAAERMQRFVAARKGGIAAVVEGPPADSAPAEGRDVRAVEPRAHAEGWAGDQAKIAAPVRRYGAAEADVHATIDELRSELQAIRALLQDVRRRVEREDRAVFGQGVGTSEAVPPARARAGR
ncbi:MAG: hypothetical protein JNK49_04880 [Planctomycetes bacterium]|nr:hypothetical protein [Planctomycetota bacterium]